MLCHLFIPSDFFNIFFKTLIMTIECERMLTNLDNRTDDYNGHLKKNYDTASYPTDFI